MQYTFALPHRQRYTVHRQMWRASFTWVLWFLGLVCLTAVVALMMVMGGPRMVHIAWPIYLLGAVAILYRSRFGVYLIVFFALAGDSNLAFWYPFVKNFSSRESLLFLNDSLIISPAEVYMALTFVSWLGKGAMQRKLQFHVSQVFWPSLIFICFIFFGLGYGISKGGAIDIALWEARPIFYLPVMVILASNLLTKREHFHEIMWLIVIALWIESFMGVHYYFVVLKMNLSLVESITEHSAAIHMNSLFVLALAAWLYKASLPKRFFLPLLVPPVLLTYLVTQRRAAFVTMIIALIFMAVILYREHRNAFWLIVPPIAILGILYVAAFWNVQGAVGMPAQAVKSIIAEDQASQADQRSNLYREIENVNSHFTIRKRMLTGVGFGKKFLIIVPMPDISFFIWWEYITHNSIIWIWMKTGVGGFASMLFLIGIAVMTGMGALARMPESNLKAIALTGTLYIIMHFVYAYVDMSWDSQSMIYVGTMMGMLGTMERVVARPVPLARKRWPWQPDPQPAPTLLPVPGE